MTRDELLERMRDLQARRGIAVGGKRDLRVILEFDAVEDPALIADAILAELRLVVHCAPLGRADEALAVGGANDLRRFLAATLVSITPADLEGSPFELGYAVGEAAGAITAEPELGTDFFPELHVGDDALEGLGEFPPGCWVDQQQDPSGAKPDWVLTKISAQAAWGAPPSAEGAAKGRGITVFQPDTGVARHVELEGAVDMARAYDFVEDKAGATDPMDYSGNPGHGTGTASVVASREGGRMSGIAPLATLVPLRAIESVIVFDHGRVAEAVDFARRHGAHVITMSLGGAWSSSLRAAIRQAIREGIIVLAAAGNCVGVVVWPARYEEVVAVAGSNIIDKPWKGSCRGEEVDITAPGEFVPRANVAPQNGGSAEDVRGGQGTSFAVAATAGVAALWLAHHGLQAVKAAAAGTTVQQLFVSALQATARAPHGWATGDYGPGIVDAAALISLPLASIPRGGLESTGAADGLHSLRTLARTASLDALESAGPAAAAMPADRRLAAEISHLLLERRRDGENGEMHEGLFGTPMSPTLAARLTNVGPA